MRAILINFIANDAQSALTSLDLLTFRAQDDLTTNDAQSALPSLDLLTFRAENDLTAKKRDRHLTANTGNEATQVYEAGAYGAPHATDLYSDGIRQIRDAYSNRTKPTSTVTASAPKRLKMRVAPRSALEVFMRKVASTDARRVGREAEV